jgi:hypothetical protein
MGRRRLARTTMAVLVVVVISQGKTKTKGLHRRTNLNREWTRMNTKIQKRTAAPKFSGVKWTQIYADSVASIAFIQKAPSNAKP